MLIVVLWNINYIVDVISGTEFRFCRMTRHKILQIKIRRFKRVFQFFKLQCVLVFLKQLDP